MQTEENREKYNGVGRNDPCPCHSGRKFKRCHGQVEKEVDLTAPPSPQPALTPTGMPSMEGFDPSKMDPEWMKTVSQSLSRLPKGQLQRIQVIMQKAMAGKDVTREAQELEKILPPDFQNLMKTFPAAMGAMGGAPEQGVADPASLEMPHDESSAKKVILDAFTSGKISMEEALKVLSAEELQKAVQAAGPKGIGKLFKAFSKK